jgi:hypothetical protein
MGNIVPTQKMPENQGHGKKWETDLGLNVYKATQAELDTVPHTAPIDVPNAFNRLEGIDVSIKVTGKDTIDMADILRVYDEVNGGKKFHITVVFWEQNGPTTKKLKSISEVDLTNSRELLFGSVKREQLVDLVTATKAVGKMRPSVSAEERAQKISSAKRLCAELHRISRYMHFHLMFYTNDPSRVQGQFTRFYQFVKEHPERLVAESQTCEFRGGKIAEEIESTPRVRNKKVSPEVSHWENVKKNNPELELTKKGLPSKRSKVNKDIIANFPFTP